MLKPKRFWCLLFDNGPNEPFHVKIRLDELILDLLMNIKSTDSDLGKYDAHKLLLYKVSIFQANLFFCSSTHGR
jgi:hypothetical protein